MYKPFIRTAAILGAISVALGAFGAHGLKGILSLESMQIYETAVKYQFYHVFALLISGILYAHFPIKPIKWAGNCFLLGILIFSGSLYALAWLSPGYKFLGAITPLGGLFFILGWLSLFYAMLLNSPKVEN